MTTRNLVFCKDILGALVELSVCEYSPAGTSCYWNSINKADHWTEKDWSVRDQLNVGEQNLIDAQLTPRDKIVFSPLHIKLRLMKQFVKALDKQNDCFQYICKISKSE